MRLKTGLLHNLLLCNEKQIKSNESFNVFLEKE